MVTSRKSHEYGLEIGCENAINGFRLKRYVSLHGWQFYRKDWAFAHDCRFITTQALCGQSIERYSPESFPTGGWIGKRRDIKRALTSGTKDPKLGSRLIVYSLAQAFSVSPLEIYNMPAELVNDMLLIHMTVKEMESEEMKKITNKHKRWNYDIS